LHGRGIVQEKKKGKPMKTQFKRIQTEKSPSSAYNFNVVTDTLPEWTFTVGGIIYPKSQFAEVLPYWFQDKPLPPSKWRP